MSRPCLSCGKQAVRFVVLGSSEQEPTDVAKVVVSRSFALCAECGTEFLEDFTSVFPWLDPEGIQ